MSDAETATTLFNELIASRERIAELERERDHGLEELTLLLAKALGETLNERNAARAEIDGSDHLAGNPTKWGLRACLKGAIGQRNAAQARIAELEDGLQPFADYAEHRPGMDFGDGEIGEYYHAGLRISINTRDLRRARALLSPPAPKPGGSDVP